MARYDRIVKERDEEALLIIIVKNATIRTKISRQHEIARAVVECGGVRRRLTPGRLLVTMWCRARPTRVVVWSHTSQRSRL